MGATTMDAPKKALSIITYQIKNKSAGSTGNQQTYITQGKSGAQEIKKKSSHAADLKGAQASKKLNAIRGRPSPRKRDSGTSKKPTSQVIPRVEVFTSAKSTISSFVSGSVESQKPPSKKI